MATSQKRMPSFSLAKLLTSHRSNSTSSLFICNNKINTKKLETTATTYAHKNTIINIVFRFHEILSKKGVNMVGMSVALGLR